MSQTVDRYVKNLDRDYRAIYDDAEIPQDEILTIENEKASDSK